MQSKVDKLRSVAETQATLAREISASMKPEVEAQVAATAATVVATLCIVAAEVLEATETGQADKATVTVNDIVKKLVAKNDALRRAGASGNWEQLSQLIDAYVGPSEEDVST